MNESQSCLRQALLLSRNVEDLMALKASIITDELVRRGLPTSGSLSERAKRIIEDNIRVSSETNNQNTENPSASNPGEDPDPIIAPRREDESTEEYLARVLASLGQTLSRSSRNVAGTNSIRFHTTPDLSHGLPTFSGKASDDPIDFIRSIERTALQQHWSDDLTVPMAVSKLRGEARDWHEVSGIEIEGDWDEWKLAFLRHFDRDISLSEWISALQSRKQEPGETLTEYIQGKLKMFRRGKFNGSVQDKVDSVCAGIRNPETRSILWKRYNDIDEFMDEARVRQRFDDNERKIREQSAPKAYNEAPKRRLDSSNSRPESKRNMHPFRNTTLQYNGSVCYNCNTQGHLSRDCLRPKTEQTLRAEERRGIRPSTRNDNHNPNRQINCFLRTIDPVLPVVQGYICGYIPVKVCIDTGSNISVVRENVLPEDIHKNTWNRKCIIKVLDHSFEPDHYVTLDVKIGNSHAHLREVVVSSSCPFDLLLGSDWRNLMKVDVTFHPDNDVTVVSLDRKNGTITARDPSQETEQGETLIVSCCRGSLTVREDEVSNHKSGFLTLTSTRSNERIDNEVLEQINNLVSAVTNDATTQQRDRIHDVLIRHQRAFADRTDSIGMCPHAEHSIELRDNIPVSSRPYRCSLADREFMKQKINEYLRMGIIRTSDSEYAAPTMVVDQPHHPTTPRRMVHDYRKLNKKTIIASYPMPVIDDALSEMMSGKAKYFSVMDVKAAFLTVRMKESDTHKTAFVTPDGKYEYLRMAFGFCGAPQTMQKVMRKTFEGMSETVTYMDDVGQGSATIDAATDRLEESLRRVEQNGLKMELAKCQLIRTEVTFLGYVISANGRVPDPKRVASIDKFKPHENSKCLYSFLQFANYYRKFVPSFSRVTQPLRDLLKKNSTFNWTNQHQEIVDDLKHQLKTPPTIANFVLGCPTTVLVDASQKGLGAVLQQTQNGVSRVIEYASRSLNDHDSKLHSNVLECMAVHWAITEKFYIYLRGGPKFTILTDNFSVRYLFDLSKTNRRFARWVLDLMEYQYEVAHVPGKSNVPADALSRLASDDASNDTDTSAPTSLKTDEEFKICSAVLIAADSRLRSLQDEDPECMQLLRTRTEDNSRFEIENGVLVRRVNEDGKTRMNIVVPKTLRKDVLMMCHDYSGHMDFVKTADKVLRRYWWPGASKDIREYVRTCPVCALSNRRTIRPEGILRPRKIPEEPGMVISVDYFGPMASTTGRTHVIVAIDHATRYVHATSISSTSTAQYVNFIAHEWICRFGVPYIIVTDQGRGFLSKMSSEFHRRMGITHVVAPAYWPQANGLAERMVGTMKQALRKIVLERPNWTEILSELVFWINVSKQSSTGFSPFELMHGYQPRIPGEMRIGSISLDLNEADRLLALARRREASQRNLENSQRKQKVRYDKARQEIRFEPGDPVYCELGNRRSDLDPVYDGPFEIAEFVTENTVKLRRIDPIPGRMNQKIANTQQLKRCVPRSDPPNQDPQR